MEQPPSFNVNLDPSTAAAALALWARLDLPRAIEVPIDVSDDDAVVKFAQPPEPWLTRTRVTTELHNAQLFADVVRGAAFAFSAGLSGVALRANTYPCALFAGVVPGPTRIPLSPYADFVGELRRRWSAVRPVPVYVEVALNTSTDLAMLVDRIESEMQSPRANLMFAATDVTNELHKLTISGVATEVLRRPELLTVDVVAADIVTLFGAKLLAELGKGERTTLGMLELLPPMTAKLIDIVADDTRDIGARATAAEVLGRKRAVSAAPALLQVLCTTTSPWLYETALSAIVSLPGDAGVAIDGAARRVLVCPHGLTRGRCDACGFEVSSIRKLQRRPDTLTGARSLALSEAIVVRTATASFTLRAGESIYASSIGDEIRHAGLVDRHRILNAGDRCLAVIGPHGRGVLDGRHTALNAGPLRFTWAHTVDADVVVEVIA